MRVCYQKCGATKTQGNYYINQPPYRKESTYGAAVIGGNAIHRHLPFD